MSVDEPRVLAWEEVKVVHRTIAGVAIQGGRAASILCNQGKKSRYPDVIEDRVLHYFLSRSTPFRYMLALVRSLEQRAPVRVFERLGTNRWRDHGCWIPVSASEVQSDWLMEFTFERPVPTSMVSAQR
jgi:hypothetical protein